MGLFITSQLSRHVLEFTPVNERVASLHLRVANRPLTVISACGPNTGAEYPSFLELLGGCWMTLRLGSPLFCLGTLPLTVRLEEI